MEYPYLTTKISGIKPESEYEGKTYDQTVFLELPDGKIIDVFDGQMICKSQMLGMVKKVTISIDIGDIEDTVPRFGIDPSYVPDKPSGQGHRFYGKIENVDLEHCEISVNVGVGKILAMPAGSQIKKFSVGDFVNIFSVRADLVKISDN